MLLPPTSVGDCRKTLESRLLTVVGESANMMCDDICRRRPKLNASGMYACCVAPGCDLHSIAYVRRGAVVTRRSRQK